MSWSLGETAALALKAARGGGLSWGLAEEAAAAVIWLHANGLPGVSALCSYLGNPDGKPRTDGACPILTGCALIDGAMSVPTGAGELVDIGPVRAPLLLLPFLARLEGGCIWLLSSHSDSTEDHIVDGTAGDGFASHCLSGAATCRLLQETRRQVTAPQREVLRLADQFACCVDRLGTFAHRTYAPATGQSRMSGAGAGLTDND